ncbi:hypothetical protein MKZ38_007156 [Zalerion maritima]|uniref:Uncharacterized protein n=1 Tax=Zalerion maritima TaxID=339359 RepID=A0AAD5RV10_9PEZI|nr:hypothetical protein MKZ38_007156 [Zalerion maritima]
MVIQTETSVDPYPTPTWGFIQLQDEKPGMDASLDAALHPTTSVPHTKCSGEFEVNIDGQFELTAALGCVAIRSIGHLDALGFSSACAASDITPRRHSVGHPVPYLAIAAMGNRDTSRGTYLSS